MQVDPFGLTVSPLLMFVFDHPLHIPHAQAAPLHARPRPSRSHAKFPEIETWPNQFPGYEIVIDDPEFTSVCPKTGLPTLA